MELDSKANASSVDVAAAFNVVTLELSDARDCERSL